MELKKGRKKREYRKSTALGYILGVLGLLLLVSAAFIGPKIVFAMQDNIKCREIVTKSPEEVDVTSFNTGYETNLYKRLARFAAGLAEGEQYYVSVQDMEITLEIRDWLENYWYDSVGFSLLVWSLGVLPEEVFSYELLDWKRCVIYGDDFAGGVNFILWYVELGIEGNPVVRLLLDGETGDIYGVRTDFSGYPLSEKGLAEYTGLLDGLTDTYGIYDTGEWDGIMWEWCIQFCEYFGGLTELDGMRNYLAKMGYEYIVYKYGDDNIQYNDGGSIQYNGEGRIQVEENWDAVDESLLYRTDTAEYDLEEIKAALESLYWKIDAEDGNMSFYFPYGENQMELCFRLNGKIRVYSKWGTRYMDVIFGFPEIFERVPVFMEN